MNITDFKKILGADPKNQDPDFLRARDSDPAFQQAADQSEAFEGKLERALNIPAPPGLHEHVRAVADEPPAAQPRWPAYAMAAAVLLAVGAVTVLWQQPADQWNSLEWDSLEDYVVDHWGVDGELFIQLADGLPAGDVDDVLGRLGVEVSPALAGHIDYINICRTPDAMGAHMVLHTENGPVTLIFMPAVEVRGGETMTFDSLVARTLPLPTGSAVIIAPDAESIAPVYVMARDAIRPAA